MWNPGEFLILFIICYKLIRLYFLCRLQGGFNTTNEALFLCYYQNELLCHFVSLDSFREVCFWDNSPIVSFHPRHFFFSPSSESTTTQIISTVVKAKKKGKQEILLSSIINYLRKNIIIEKKESVFCSETLCVLLRISIWISRYFPFYFFLLLGSVS